MPAGSTSPAAASPPGLMLKLSLMMFLQFFIWGAWFEIGFSYIPGLKFTEWWMNGLVFGAFNIGALVALFFSTQLADRKFAAEKFLAFSHLIGGAAMIGLFALPEPIEFWPFFGLMLLHSVFYVPTISITNSIAFAAFTNPEKQFGPVRLWGTIGWIVASWPFIFILVDWNLVNQSGKTGLDWLGEALATPLTGASGQIAKGYAFLVAGIASLVLAAFSLTLPHTPPKPAAAGPKDWSTKRVQPKTVMMLWCSMGRESHSSPANVATTFGSLPALIANTSQLAAKASVV
jgi:MFS family permease